MSGSGAAPALHHGRRSTTTATAASASASTASAALPARSLPPCPFAASPPPPSSARRGWRPAMELEQSRSVTCRPDTAAGNAQLSCGLVKPERRTGATGCHCGMRRRMRLQLSLCAHRLLPLSPRARTAHPPSLFPRLASRGLAFASRANARLARRRHRRRRGRQWRRQWRQRCSTGRWRPWSTGSRGAGTTRRRWAARGSRARRSRAPRRGGSRSRLRSGAGWCCRCLTTRCAASPSEKRPVRPSARAAHLCAVEFHARLLQPDAARPHAQRVLSLSQR